MTSRLLVVDASALVEFLLRRIFELRQNFGAYDATYVTLAEDLEASLVSGDDRLARAVRRWTQVEVAEA